MPVLKQNRLIPLMAIVALLVVGFIFWRVARDGESSVPAGKPLDAVPAATEPAETARSGFLSAAKNTKTGKTADADTPTETIRTLTAEVATMRNDMQQLADTNRQLHGQLAQTQLNKEALKNEIKAELQSTPAPSAPIPPSAPPSGAPAPAASGGLAGLVGNLPSGFGFEHAGAGALSGAGTEIAPPPRPASRVIPPRGRQHRQRAGRSGDLHPCPAPRARNRPGPAAPRRCRPRPWANPARSPTAAPNTRPRRASKRSRRTRPSTPSRKTPPCSVPPP